MAALDAVTKKRLHSAWVALSKQVTPTAVYLFGSRVDGRVHEWSDYDLAVFIEGAEDWDLTSIVKLCSSVQKEAGDDIELHVFPASRIDKPEPGSFSEYVLKHGIQLIPAELAA